ncbi:MAG: NAD(P)H-dependent oxidoreductase [Armatimonadetes bacterium]|nr:NAD(P)H-dependent oxidoreductase [Armatimonadota bacterium]
MRLLGLSGSPREGGNTDTAVREVLRQALTHGPLETELVRVMEQKVGHCTGCRQCMKLKRCVLGDDFESLWGEVTAAEGLVVGAPVYWFGPPGVMKDFIDRTHGAFAVGGGRALREKPVLLLSVAADSGFEPHEETMCSWLTYYGASIIDRVRLFARETGDLAKDPTQMQSLRDAADNLCRELLP